MGRWYSADLSYRDQVDLLRKDVVETEKNGQFRATKKAKIVMVCLFPRVIGVYAESVLEVV